MKYRRIVVAQRGGPEVLRFVEEELRKRPSLIFRPPCSGIWSSPAPWASRKSGSIGCASGVRCATALMTNGCP